MPASLWAVAALGFILALSACTGQGLGPQNGDGVGLTPRQSLPDQPPPDIKADFPKTDFSRHSIPYREIQSGGPPRDGIPSIDNPHFVSVNEADAWLRPQEPVVLLELDAEAKAYPLQILIWHEIVNDVVGRVPVIVTWCPLCNTGIAFRREVNGRVLDFGTTGRLRFSNLLMYDRQTESWWQQATGEAIIGEMTGRRLAFVPAGVVSWRDFKEAHPEGSVLSRETGYSRPYGTNPYPGYDDVGQLPFLYQGPTIPDKLPAMARVLTVDIGGDAVAYPYEVLARLRVVNDTAGGHPIVVFWRKGASSPLDAPSVAMGRDVGSAGAFSRILEGRLLTFDAVGEQFRDRQTGTTWDLLGQALRGPLAGQRLEPVTAINHFWFSWAAFKPQTRIYSEP